MQWQTFYGEHELALDEAAAALDWLPGAKLGRLLGEISVGEKASGLKEDHDEKLKEVLVEAGWTGLDVFGPEEIIERIMAARLSRGAKLGLHPLQESLLHPGLKGPHAVGKED